jgi:hypothetical protein
MRLSMLLGGLAHRQFRRIPVSWLLALALAACSRTPQEPDARGNVAVPSVAPLSTPPQVQMAPGSAASARDIVWNDPPGWSRTTPSSAMRKASYKVRHAPKDAEDVEVAVFYFGGEGGGTEANIQRWIGQFSGAKPGDTKRTERTINSMKQTVVEVEGTYGSGMPGGEATPKTGFRLLGAVVETPKGNYFFKMTGPKDSVAAARDAFFGMLDSVRQQ